MLHITSLDDGLDIFKALGSDVRIEIIKLLIENKEMNMNELAAKLNITNGALTGHIKKLEACGIVNTSNDSSGHGNQKICTLHLVATLMLPSSSIFSTVPSTPTGKIFSMEISSGAISFF